MYDYLEKGTMELRNKYWNLFHTGIIWTKRPLIQNEVLKMQQETTKGSLISLVLLKQLWIGQKEISEHKPLMLPVPPHVPWETFLIICNTLPLGPNTRLDSFLI